jgi:hypothetical protein
VLAAAAPAQTYTIKLKHAPDPGKSVVIKDSDSHDVLTKIFDAGGKAIKEDKAEEKRDEVYTETVIEKSDKFPTKYKRTYEKATRTRNGKTESRSYEGRTIVFEQKDGKFTVTADGDKPLSKADLEDLAKKANDNDKEMDELFLPQKPVKAGDGWDIDSKALAKSFARNAELDPDKSSAKAKLAKVYDKDGKKFGEIEVTLKLTPKTPADVKFESPPTIDMKVTLNTAIDGSSTAGTMKMTGKMKSKVTVEQMGMKFTVDSALDMKGEQERSAEK